MLPQDVKYHDKLVVLWLPRMYMRISYGNEVQELEMLYYGVCSTFTYVPFHNTTLSPAPDFPLLMVMR